MAEQEPAARRSALGLELLVFVGGGCLMAVEIVGGMAIAPYFGSNVFVWGSVIGVFMGALSLGYVLGGRLADKNPRPFLLCALAAAAGVLVVLVPLIGPGVCKALLRADLGRALNPLLPLAATVLLYFVPSALLGMIVPMAVRIASTALSSIGRVVGRLYALNALGSVAGALGSTFLLVVFFGNRAILFGCGVVLILVAVASWYLQRGVAAAAAPHTEPGAAGPSRPVAGLRPLVFACGTVLMSLEVIGGAEIAPYFGSSVFVWGSVITVCLAALTAGYRLGGRLADRRPTMMTLATIVVAAGITTLLIPLIAPAVCKAFLGRSFGGGLNILRPLLASALLYFVPITLFAMVAPFAVRLSTRQVGAVGGVAGRLYALSTLGNVTGVLLTTFVLISAIGKTRLFELAGLLAVLVAVVAVFLHNRTQAERRQPWLASGLLILSVVALALLPKPALVPITAEDEKVLGVVAPPGRKSWYLIELGWSDFVERADEIEREYQARHFLRRVRAERESPYHHIAVIERAMISTEVLGKEVFKDEHITTTDGRKIKIVPSEYRTNCRDLRFDQYVESSVVLDDRAEKIRIPLTSGTRYSDLLHLPLVFNPDVKDVLIVGGGGGVVPMIFKRAYSDTNPGLTIDVVEIDPVVVDVAEKHFGMKTDDRLHVYVQDGRMFIHNSKKTYDLIILDAYTAGGRIPFHLTTKEFLTEVRDHLNPSGVALMNVISAIEGPASKLFRAEYKTFKAVFGAEHVYVFPRTSDYWEPTQSTNVILIATGSGHRHRLSPEQVVQRATERVAANRIKIKSVVDYAADMLTDRALKALRLDDVPLLTDDYAPVDMMTVELDRD